MTLKFHSISGCRAVSIIKICVGHEILTVVSSNSIRLHYPKKDVKVTSRRLSQIMAR